MPETPAQAGAGVIIGSPDTLGDQASSIENEVSSAGKLGEGSAPGYHELRNAGKDISLAVVSKQILGLSVDQEKAPQSHALEHKADNSPQNPYDYSPLLEGSIRLLSLLPAQDADAPIQSRLFDYSLHESGEKKNLYEALSYVWGSSDKPCTIFIEGRYLQVTTNLYAALLRLRDRFFERIIWIDAICINQSDLKERGDQVRSMANIYYKASRVVVWLGEAENNSDKALEEICLAVNEQYDAKPLEDKTNEQAILTLLQRSWFRRIWVLQEVAAARHIMIMCGSVDVDGFAFCLGLQSLQLSNDTFSELLSLVRSLNYLIRVQIFRLKNTISPLGEVSLGIRPLGELINMYHNREATERHDKIFALIGMSSDNPSVAGLSPDYTVPWEELFEKLVKFLLGSQVYVRTWPDMEVAVIEAKGRIHGWISSINGDQGRDNRQQVTIMQKGPRRKLTLSASAKSVQVGDLICLLRGVSKPVIARPRKDHLLVVMIAVPLEDERTKTKSTRPPEEAESFPRDILLVWDWEKSQEVLQGQQGDILLSSRIPSYLNAEMKRPLEKITRLQNMVQILEDVEQYEQAENSFQELVKDCEVTFGEDDLHTLRVKERLGEVYNRMWKWKKAVNLFEQVLTVRTRVQRLDHQDKARYLANTMTNLVSMLESHSYPEEAKVQLISDVLGGRGDRVQITEEAAISIAEYFDPEVMRRLLDRTEDETQTTEQYVRIMDSLYQEKMHWLSNQIWNAQIMPEMPKMPKILEAEWKQDKVSELVRSFLRKDGIQVTEEIMLATAKNSTVQVMELLLNEKGDEIQITEKVIIATIRNKVREGFEMVKLLHERRRDEIQITEEIMIAIAKGGDTKIMELLLDKRGNEIQITEKVVRAVAENREDGAKMMKLLFEQKGDEIKITSGVVMATVQRGAGDVMKLLLDRKRDEIYITEAMVRQALQSDDRGFSIITVLLEDKIVLTERVLQIIKRRATRLDWRQKDWMGRERIMKLLQDRMGEGFYNKYRGRDG